jgi:hypothetical protein
VWPARQHLAVRRPSAPEAPAACRRPTSSPPPAAVMQAAPTLVGSHPASQRLSKKETGAEPGARLGSSKLELSRVSPVKQLVS